MNGISKTYCSRNENCKKPFGAVKCGQDIEICIYPKREESVLKAQFIIKQDDENDFKYIDMGWSGYFGSCDKYKVNFNAQKIGLYWYAFKIETANETYFLCREFGGYSKKCTDLTDMFQITVFDGDYKVAKWFGKGITYNIFPDRFFRTHVPNKDGWKSKRNIHENWEETPTYLPDEKGEIWNNDFFGGNIKGVIEKLDYLKSLNVQTIYFNPIFEAFSNHRYDTGNYKNIDKMLGTNDDFKELCESAKKHGMKVILDGVFSHTGYDSKYFNARGTYDSIGAYQSKESPYYSWYDFSNWPCEYSSWWGIYTLPQVNEMNENYIDYIIESKDSVIKYWIKMGASGWRLDVADELPDEFIKKLNCAAKEENQDAIIIGEVWEDASNKISYDKRRQYFNGNELDSVMNYPLRDGVLSYMAGSPAQDFAEKIECLKENYPSDVFNNLMNLISTHDTPRALTIFGSSHDDWQKDRNFRANRILSGEELEKAKQKLFMAAVIQFTIPGSPTIYYGDEVGMQGYEDPFNRRTYPWGKEDEQILRFYRELSEIRVKNRALNEGDLKFLQAQDGILIYERFLENENIIIFVNRDDENNCFSIENVKSVNPLLGSPCIFFDEENSVSIELEPKKAYIIKIEFEEN